MSTEPLRVTLIDDDELTARGLTAMLRAHPKQIELVNMSGRGTAPIDIALYDHAMNRPSGRPTLVQLLADARIRKVAIYTYKFQPWAAADLLELGASAYLSKALSCAELLEALHTVNTGGALVSPRARFPGAHTRHQAERGEVLTDREAEMLTLISRGLNNSEIAAALNLSVNTVKSYIRSAYRKIDVESRSKAVLWGLGHGFGDTAGAALPELAADTRAGPVGE